MQLHRHFGTALALIGMLAAGHALADDIQPTHPGISQPQYGQVVTGPFFSLVQCQMGTGDVLARVLVRNTGATAIDPGAEIHWQTNGGASGIANIAGLAPGATMHVGDAPYPFTCSASVVY